jgi:hypothetical protein
MEGQIKLVESWRVVDLWWTDAPIDRYFLALRAPNGAMCCVGWDDSTGTWSLKEEESDGETEKST